MKKFIYFIIGILSIISTSCVERVDAGCEGIKFNLAGSEKGVSDVSLVSGYVWYVPWLTGIYEYPTYAQTIDYEPFDINSKDGTRFVVDPSMIVKIEDGKSPIIFKKYRKPLNNVINSALRVRVVDAARIVFNSFTADSIVSHRELVDKAFDERVRDAFSKEGFVLEQLTPGIKYPKSYEDAIDAKNVAIQNEMRISNEVKVAEANARKAEAEAQITLAKARAEAEANRLKTQSLNSMILQQLWIEKWNGTVPSVMGGNSTMMIDPSKLK